MSSPTAAARAVRLIAIPALLCGCCAAQTAALSLASGSGSPGSVVVLNLALTSTVTQPTDLQWTINYQTKDFSSFSVSAGPAITAAGRSISCNNTPGASTCVVWGMGSTAIANGVVATLVFTVSPSTTDTSSSIQVSKGNAASLSGSAIPTSATGNTVTIAGAIPTTAFTLTSVPAGLSLAVDGSTCSAPCGVQWTPGSSHTISAGSSTQAGTAGTQYVFANWSDGGALTHTVVAPGTTQTYTASFTTQYLLTTNASSGGAISPSSGWSNSGAMVSVNATPLSGNKFAGFSGSLGGTTTPQTLTMNGPASVTANFTVTASPGTAWYSNGWTSRKAITVNNGQVKGALTNFPMLYSVTDPNLIGSAQPSGNDILFTASDGVTKLNHEIESFNGATGALAAWVKIPALQSGTTIYVYWGNPASGNQQFAAGVWDSNYLEVFHFANGGGKDSTSHADNASGLLTIASDGEIGSAASMNGLTSGLNYTGNVLAGAFTMQAWVETSGFNVYPYEAVIGSQIGGLDFGLGYGTWNVIVNKPGFGSNVGSSGAVSVGGWHHIVATQDGSGNYAYYIDGNPSGNFSGGLTANAGSNTNAIGYRSGYGNLLYSGSVDEVRISNTARSAAWIAAEFNNEKTPNAFFTAGAIQSSLNSTSQPPSGGGGLSGLSLMSSNAISSKANQSNVIAASTSTTSGTSTSQPVLSGISCTPNSVIPPATSTCLVTISAAATAGGASIALSGDSTNAVLPSSVSIPSGALSASFPVATSAVAGVTTVHLTGILGSSSASTPLVLISPAADGIKTDATVSQRSTSPGTSISSPVLSTASPYELLLAFVSAGPGAGLKATSVSGGGLSWVLAKRSNGQNGTAEIWRALAPASLKDIQVTATFPASVYSSITVMSFTGIDPSGSNGSGAIGATASGSAASGAPAVTLTTTREGSLVIGVGTDTTNAAARTPGGSQSVVTQDLSPNNNTYWVQTQSSPASASGVAVGINDLSPLSDAYNLSAVEILPPSSCVPALVPTARSYPAGGGSTAVTVATGSGCGWTARSSSWITLNGNSGSGNGSFTLTAAPNGTGHARMGSVSIGNQSFSVMEAGSTQLFADVTPLAAYFDYSSLAHSSHISAACGSSPLVYCPTAPATRTAMMESVVRALDLAAGSGDPPVSPEEAPSSSQYFALVQKITDLGIPVGCFTSTSQHCPDLPVTQQEAAVFMIAAWMQVHGLTTFTYTPTPYFTDVPATSPYFKFVQKMMDLQFWSGCSSTQYCPADTVTRSEMAPMVMRSILGAP